jgi:hypothetical protein
VQLAHERTLVTGAPEAEAMDKTGIGAGDIRTAYPNLPNLKHLTFEISGYRQAFYQEY